VRTTISQLRDLKRQGQRFPMLTAYDYAMARLLDAAGIPVLLVGDSLGNVVLGYDTTLPVTLEDIVRHTQAVVRGSQQAMVVADMPFLSFQISPEEAIRNAGRLLKEGGAQAVKLEGGRTVAPTVKRLVDAGIPVMGHLGLTPQSVHQMGGYKIQGKTVQTAAVLIEDAAILEQAGVFSIVLEGVPADLAGHITRTVTVPTIGIGAGPQCDGQVQVITDLLGMFTERSPKHARRYLDLAPLIAEAVQRYAADVAGGQFPTAKESFSMDERVLHELGAERPALPDLSSSPATEPHDFGAYAPRPV
jgi:3-methyl-2-oxobutanoate hydroxymethyltransferase